MTDAIGSDRSCLAALRAEEDRITESAVNGPGFTVHAVRRLSSIRRRVETLEARIRRTGSKLDRSNGPINTVITPQTTEPRMTTTNDRDALALIPTAQLSEADRKRLDVAEVAKRIRSDLDPRRLDPA